MHGAERNQYRSISNGIKYRLLEGLSWRAIWRRKCALNKADWPFPEL